MGNSRRGFPPINPFSYHQSRHFVGRPDLAISYLPTNTQTKIISQTPLMHNRLLEDFERVRFERVGMMLGDYVVLKGGRYIMDRKGNCFSINLATDESMLAGRPFEELNSRDVWDFRQFLLDNWDKVPALEKSTIWHHIYCDNYYHFTFEFIQKARLTSSFDIAHIIMPPENNRLQFQRDLISKTLEASMIVLQETPLRVINPVIADAWQSFEGLDWLRRTMKLEAPPGANRYYVRRTPTTARRGSNIAESAEFLDFVRRHDFKTVDFGNGDVPISEQVAMLREPSIILAPHGAGLTNIAYLNPPLTIIEYFSRRVLFAAYMQIAITLGFRYFGIISEEEDADFSIVPDVQQLEAIMDEIAG